MKSPLEILSGYARPGERMLVALKGRQLMSKGATAVAALLVSPAAMQGTDSIIGLSNRALVLLNFNFFNHLLKPRSAFHLDFADIADCTFSQSSHSARLEILQRDGRKLHLGIDGDTETTSAFVNQLQQFRQQTGFSAQSPAPVAPAPQPPTPQPAPPPPQYAAAPPQPAPAPAAYAQPQPAASAPSATRPCPQCRQQTDADGKFCEYCGALLAPPQPQVLICTNCRKELKATARFCGRCGTEATRQSPSR